LIRQIDSIAELFHAEWYKLHDPMNYPPDSTLYKQYREDIAQVQEQQKELVVKDELWETYLKNGGTGLNASTGNDATQYYVSLPSNRLELWALLESDRFRNTIFREFYSERDVVYEERRMRTDNRPWGKLGEQLSATAFTSSGYHHPVVGWATDIETFDHDLLKDYYHTYYTPNNMIAVICGDVDAEEVFKLAEKHFGDWERGPKPPRQSTMEPKQTGEKRVTVEFDANPSLYLGYHIPAAGHPDIAALDLLSDILSSGRTSRLNKEVVENKKIATSAWAGSSFSRYPDLFTCGGTPLKGHTTLELEEAIYEEIEKMKTEPVTQWELEKVKNQYDSRMIRSVNSNMGLCWRLSHYEAMTGSWDYINTYWTDLKAVTADDIMRVANEYLVESNRTVATLVKTESESDAAPKRKPGKRN